MRDENKRQLDAQAEGLANILENNGEKSAAHTVRMLLKRVEEAEEGEKDAISTLKAWFELADKTEAEIEPVLMDCVDAYIRTSENGGMPTKMANDLKRHLHHIVGLYACKALVPVLRGIAKGMAA